MDVSSVNTTTILLTSPRNILQQMGTDKILSQITKLFDELHFTNTFHYQNLYIYAFKMLLTRSFDVSNFAVTT